MARGKRFSPEQIVVMLRQIEVQLAQGQSLALACKEAGLSEQAQGRMPEGRDLLQLERGSGRDRRVARPLQSGAAPLGTGLSPTRARHPHLRQPPTHTKHHAVVSPNPAQNSGQVT